MLFQQVSSGSLVLGLSSFPIRVSPLAFEDQKTEKSRVRAFTFQHLPFPVRCIACGSFLLFSSSNPYTAPYTF